MHGFSHQRIKCCDLSCRESTSVMRLLIVDNHDSVRKAVCVILSRRKDLDCVEAVNGREAVEKSREGKPDAIIMDVSMPIMDGFTAAREIKKFLPDVPIIFLSVHSGGETIQQSKLVGGQAFVSKKDASSELPKALDAVLQKRQYFPSAVQE